MPFLRVAGMVAALVVLAGLVHPGATQAQPDSVRAAILKKKGFPPDHSPTGALWRSAAVPGWGQYYNRQYYKMPFVYAGFAALGYRIYTSHQEYLLFKRAHIFGREQEMSGTPTEAYRDEFNDAVDQLGGERLAAMRSQRDQFRRRRDLAILGSGVFYALTILDAYVSAHLLTFDIGDELAVRVHPIGDLRGGAFRRRSGPTLDRSPEQTALERGPGMRIRLHLH